MGIEWDDAKEILNALITNGELDDSILAKDVYNNPEYKEIFHKVKWDRFRPNLKNLRDRLKKEKDKSDFDQHAFDHDRSLNPIDKSKLRWPGSEAEEYL